MDIFTKIYAQSADAVAKSTIPFLPPGIRTPTPFVTTTVAPTTQLTEPIIYLETTTSQMMVGVKTTVRIRINTMLRPVKSFKFMIKYDPEYFQITDALPAVANVQISFNDTFFINDINEVDTSAGTISITASSDQGTTTISGRAVAEFEIKSLKEGFSQITLQQINSSLLDSNNTDILASIGTPLDFVISNTEVTVTVTPTVPAPTPTGTLPRNGIFDGLGATNALISGTILIAIGIYIYTLQKNAKKKV